MKEYIVLYYTDKSLVFDFRVLNEDEREYKNKNIFYKDSLFYTLKYFKKNINEIINLIKDKQYEIDWFIVMRILTFRYVAIIMNELKLSKLRLLFNSTLSIEDYNILLTIESLRKIDCYFMPDFMVDKFNDENIDVKLNNTYKISNNFILEQDSLDYDALYYKKSIVIKKEYDGLLDDIKEFLRINYNLSSIDIYIYSKEIIEKIVEYVKNDESKNVVVLLHQSSDKGNFIGENFVWLKGLNEECKQELSCEFRILYSNNFIKNNLFKQLSFNNLKLISILAIYICSAGFIIYKSYSYVEKLNSDKVVTDLINESANSLDINEELSGIDVDLPAGEEEIEVDKYKIENIMSSLKKTNNETVGYLVVNETNIAYPVVQHSDNSYYFKRDFYKNSTSMGWIYLDYRNSNNNFDMNNVIYGHSMKNGTMFGTLKKVLSSNWRKDPNNMIISYDTTYGSYKFKIFSIYKVDYTTDYLKINFDSENEFNDFVKMIKDRSIFNSNENVNYGDIILTLSTCTGTSNQRLVVHAVMQKVGE